MKSKNTDESHRCGRGRNILFLSQKRLIDAGANVNNVIIVRKIHTNNLLGVKQREKTLQMGGLPFNISGIPTDACIEISAPICLGVDSSKSLPTLSTQSDTCGADNQTPKDLQYTKRCPPIPRNVHVYRHSHIRYPACIESAYSDASI